MSNKFLTGLIVSGIIVATGASAYAYNNQDTREAIRKAIVDNNYQAWTEAISDLPNATDLLNKINESNFSQLTEAEKLMKEGKREEAKTIFDQLGIKGLMGGQGKRGGMGNPEQMQAVMTAIENNDYSAWKDAVGKLANGSEILAKVNETNFSKVVEAYNLAKDGKMDEAKAIVDELGLNGLIGMGPMGEPSEMKAIRTALENNDYNAWKTAVANLPNADEQTSKINENNFSQLVEAFNLDKQSKEILKDLGVRGFGGMGRGRGGHPGMGPDIQDNDIADNTDTSTQL